MRIDWKEYFSFSKKDRVGAVVIIILIVLITAGTYFYQPANQLPVTIAPLNQELSRQGVDTISAGDEQTTFIPSDETEVANSGVSGELFTFDPNTLDAAGFKRLGMEDKTIRTLLNYRSKGGYFRLPNDIRKIYGLRKEVADKLIPYIQIAGSQQPFVHGNEQPVKNTASKPAKIDINTATPDQWKALPAIGDVLANRIVKFRDKIGGFTSVLQVKQTYGLSDSAFTAIEPYLQLATAPQKNSARGGNNGTGKININTASLNQLESNPHISPEVAQAIIIYRSQHGNFSNVEDLKKIVFINTELYNQIAPYLTVE